MPHDIGFVTAQDSKPSHYQMLQKIKELAVRSGDWELLREDTGTENHEIILKGRGYSQKEEIFVGVRTYQNANADYYNLAVATFTGFVPSNPFDNQPSAKLSGVPAHNQRIDYWLTVNPQRIACCMKVGTPVYEHFYIGKFLPYARPSQYPYPVVCAGMLDGTPATRFSDTSHSFPYKGNRKNLAMRFNTGVYLNVECYPYNSSPLTSSYQLRDTNGVYPLMPIILTDNNGIYGEFDGVRFVSGFDNVTENMCGDDWVVLQDVGRRGINDYIALRLDK